METATTTTAKPVAHLGMRTPWGKADHVRQVAAGVASVSTPGHGGFKLSRALNTQVHEAWRQKAGWYEEDCAWSIVAVTFPAFFPKEEEAAHATARDNYPDAYAVVTGTKVAVEDSYVLRQRAFDETNKDNFVVVTAYGDWKAGVPKGFIQVVATKGGVRGTPEKHFLVPAEEYTGSRFVVDLARHEETQAF